MKKYAWMLALALPMSVAFTSCGDDEEEEIIPDPTPEEVTLDRTSVSINYKSTDALKASVEDGVWASSDEFVASVDDKGVVTAKHVGEAIITVSKDGNSASCKVTVNPTDHTYTLPIMTWGASMTAVENSVSGLVKNTEMSVNNVLFYGTSTAYGYPWYIYKFDSNALSSSSLTVELTDEAMESMPDYLDQYYKQISFNDDTLVTTYANAETTAAATVIVRLSPNDEDMTNYTAAFVPNDNPTKASGAEAALDRHMEIINSIKR